MFITDPCEEIGLGEANHNIIIASENPGMDNWGACVAMLCVQRMLYNHKEKCDNTLHLVYDRCNLPHPFAAKMLKEFELQQYVRVNDYGLKAAMTCNASPEKITQESVCIWALDPDTAVQTKLQTTISMLKELGFSKITVKQLDICETYAKEPYIPQVKHIIYHLPAYTSICEALYSRCCAFHDCDKRTATALLAGVCDVQREGNTSQELDACIRLLAEYLSCTITTRDIYAELKESWDARDTAMLIAILNSTKEHSCRIHTALIGHTTTWSIDKCRCVYPRDKINVMLQRNDCDVAILMYARNRQDPPALPVDINDYAVEIRSKEGTADLGKLSALYHGKGSTNHCILQFKGIEHATAQTIMNSLVHLLQCQLLLHPNNHDRMSEHLRNI